MASKTKYDLTNETDQERFIERVFEFFDDEGFDAQRVGMPRVNGERYKLEIVFTTGDPPENDYGVLEDQLIH